MDEKKHVAFVGYPGFGHLKPTLQVVEELIRRGHRVSYVVTDHFVDAVAAAGATPVPYHSRIPDEAGVESEIDDDRMALGLINEWWEPMHEAVRYFDADRPDVVLHDAIAGETAKLLSMRFDIPRVRMFTTFATSERAVMQASPGGIDMSEFSGANILGPKFLALYAHIDFELNKIGAPNMMAVGFGAPDPVSNIVFLPKEFQPLAEKFEDSYHWVGPCLWERDTQQTWTPMRPGAPIVVVSLGTSPSNHRLEFLRACVQASAGQPWEMVMCLGKTHSPDELGVLPFNVSAHEWLPPTAVLPQATAYITHAGMGSLMESFACGVPVLVAPDIKEQWLNAFFVVQSGLGKALVPSGDVEQSTEKTADDEATFVMPLSRDEVTPERLGELIGELVNDPELRHNAAQMRADIEACGGPVAAADLIEAHLYQEQRLEA